MADGKQVEDRFLEIEHKWSADHVDWDAFVKFFRSKKKQLIEEQIVSGPDEYWKANLDTTVIATKVVEALANGGNVDPAAIQAVRGVLEKTGVGRSVVRWRANGKTFSQLTVKRRTSGENTTIREEADLNLKKAPAKDVETFLTMLGYTKELTLFKRCHIFIVETEHGIAVPVIYDIWQEGKEDQISRFVEIEAEKNQSKEQSMKILEYWTKELKKHFDLKPKDKSGLSLYEIYSGNRYWEVEGYEDDE